jgi:hypothetical protein
MNSGMSARLVLVMTPEHTGDRRYGPLVCVSSAKCLHPAVSYQRGS